MLSIYVHLYGSEALGITSSTAAAAVTFYCSVTKSGNAAIPAAAARKSESNKGVSATGNRSDSCKANHPSAALDRVLCPVGVLGTLCV